METLADVVAAGRDRSGLVVDAPDRTADYSYDEFATNAWKAGNLLRHYGVRAGATMALVTGPKSPTAEDKPGWLGSAADPLLALLGGATVGAVIDLTPTAPVDARAIVLPDGWLDRYDVAPGCSQIAYGGPPETAGVAHFERELWSENPIQPPGSLAADNSVLCIDGKTYTHGHVLDAARAIADERGLTDDDSVAIDAPLTTAETVAAGVVAPLLVGATILLTPPEPLPNNVRYVVSRSDWSEQTVEPGDGLDV